VNVANNSCLPKASKSSTRRRASLLPRGARSAAQTRKSSLISPVLSAGLSYRKRRGSTASIASKTFNLIVIGK